MPSLDNTVISLPGQSIVDALGKTWSIVKGQVAVNGVVDPTTGRVIQLAYEHGKVWQKNSDNMWWSKTSATAAWYPPTGTAVDPIQNLVTSVNNTVVLTTAHHITDAAGNTWSILNGQVALNDVADLTTTHVTELAYESGKIWQENLSGLWWSKTKPSDAWAPLAGTATSPIVHSTTKTWIANDPSGDAINPLVAANFFDRENWGGGVAPVPGDTAVIRDGNASFSGPQGPGALGEAGLSVLFGATDPTKTAGMTMTTNVTLAPRMTLLTGATTGLANYLGSIFAISSTLTNEGHITVVAASGSAELDIRMRYGTFANDGTVQETGVRGSLKILGAAQYGNAGSIVNNGSMTVSGGLIDLENPVSGTGTIQVSGNGTIKIGNSFAAGETIAITAGTLEFGPVNPGFATNSGMQFLSTISLAGASNSVLAGVTEQLKFDGAWFNGVGDRIVLLNLHLSKAELTVFEGSVKIFDATLSGHYAQNEFTLGHTGADAFVTFKPQLLTTGTATSPLPVVTVS